jgi:hypothetical protein
MKLALGADVQIGLKIFAKDDRAAGLAFDPQAFRTDAAFLGRRGLLDRSFLAFEPSHGESYQSSLEVCRQDMRLSVLPMRLTN